MDSLFIEGTKKTPEVNFKADGQLKISGRSIPEDPTKFYDVLYSWAAEYANHPVPETNLNVVLEYFNSGTSKALLHILRVITDLRYKGVKVSVNWYYESGDDDIYERGEYYSSILELPFNLIEVEQQD